MLGFVALVGGFTLTLAVAVVGTFLADSAGGAVGLVGGILLTFITVAQLAGR